MSIAYLGAGSNIGDRISFIQQANCLLNDSNDIKVLQCSSLYETEPVGFKDQDWFINAVLEVETSFSPEELLNHCLRIEKQLGRQREPDIHKWGPRTIDLDILFYDDMIVSSDLVQIPHPRVHMRAHALVPMIEVNENFIHPIANKTILELHNDLEEVEEVYLYGTRGLNF